MKIVQVPLAQIKPYWRNPRFNEGAVEAVMESITNYGYNAPMLLDKSHVIIAGHTRYKALQRLGYEKAPCVLLDLPPDKAKAYRIADNKTNELSDWDVDNLINELKELNAEEMQTYFPERDLEELLRESAGQHVEAPTAEGIAAHHEQLQTEFKNRNENELAAYIEVVCPECGTSFYVARHDLLKDQTNDAEELPAA